MTLERITEKNIDYAIQIQEELFPGESGRTNFEESMDKSSGYEYFLLYEDGTCIGVIGIYSYPEDQNSAWLGWFGIREDFRRKKFGTWVVRYQGGFSKKEVRYNRTKSIRRDGSGQRILVRPFVYGCCE